MAAFLEQIVDVLTPAQVSGRSYLCSLLKKHGVLELVPDACVRKLVEQNISRARMARRANRAGMKAELMQILDDTAVVTTLWIRGGELPVKEDGYVPRTLVKYGVQRGALKPQGGPPRRHHVFHSYSNFLNATVTCAMCSWSGPGRGMKVGEVHEEAQVREYYCPKCGGGRSGDYLAVAPLPPSGESRE